MLKLGIELKEDGDKLNIKILDPSKKQLETASDNEKIIADTIKDVLDKKLLEMIETCQKENK